MHRCKNRAVKRVVSTDSGSRIESERHRLANKFCEPHKIYASHYKLERPSHCGICLEALIPYKVRPLQCGHYFHGICLMQWTQGKDVPSCPTCRSERPSWKPVEVTNRKRAMKNVHVHISSQDNTAPEEPEQDQPVDNPRDQEEEEPVVVFDDYISLPMYDDDEIVERLWIEPIRAPIHSPMYLWFDQTFRSLLAYPTAFY